MIRSGKVGLRSDGDYDYDVFYIICDKCRRSFGGDDEITHFSDAVKLKKKLGFKSFQRDGKWYEFCRSCSKTIKEEPNGYSRRSLD